MTISMVGLRSHKCMMQKPMSRAQKSRSWSGMVIRSETISRQNSASHMRTKYSLNIAFQTAVALARFTAKENKDRDLPFLVPRLGLEVNRVSCCGDEW
jgi:hypothetical protein